MREINFNINHNVKVKLTDYGREILKKENNELEISYNLKKGYFELPKEDEQGYSTWQLWVLIEKLGKYVAWGKQPFSTNIIIIIED